MIEHVVGIQLCVHTHRIMGISREKKIRGDLFAANRRLLPPIGSLLVNKHSIPFHSTVFKKNVQRVGALMLWVRCIASIYTSIPFHSTQFINSIHTYTYRKCLMGIQHDLLASWPDYQTSVGWLPVWGWYVINGILLVETNSAIADALNSPSARHTLHY